MDLVAAVVADEQPLELMQPSEGGSTIQRKRPSPEPCAVLRQAISEVMPR
jgi:hypothetical protein